MTSELETLKIIAFPGAPNLPIYAAIAEGIFERAGLSVELELTPSSIYQAEQVAAGAFDIAMTAFDNVVAYSEGQGAAGPGVDPEYAVVMGATQLELSLIVSPDVKEFADLKGRTIALDAKATGFAFALSDMLARAGLGENDTEYVAVGATPQRWQSVQAGDHAGTLTIEPFTTIATRAGFHVLQKSTDIYDSYQGGVVAANRGFLARRPDTVRTFIRCYLEALDWVKDPANRTTAASHLQTYMPAIKPQAVEPVMNSVLDPKSGLTPQGEILPDGMARVLDLRSRFGPGNTKLTDIDRYLELSIYESVIAEADA